MRQARSVWCATKRLLSPNRDVVVVGPHCADALLARDCGDPGPDLDRRFDYVITHDRPLVLRAARALLQWVTPSVEVV